jgi:hypothetical protein
VRAGNDTKLALTPVPPKKPDNEPFTASELLEKARDASQVFVESRFSAVKATANRVEAEEKYNYTKALYDDIKAEADRKAKEVGLTDLVSNESDARQKKETMAQMVNSVVAYKRTLDSTKVHLDRWQVSLHHNVSRYPSTSHPPCRHVAIWLLAFCTQLFLDHLLIAFPIPFPHSFWAFAKLRPVTRTHITLLFSHCRRRCGPTTRKTTNSTHEICTMQ